MDMIQETQKEVTMSDFFDEPGVGMGGTADVPSRSGVHCDACNEWMDVDDVNCPNCGSER